MLVLSRKEGERIVISLPNGERIEVVVCRIDGHRVKIGIEAPRAVQVSRPKIGQRV